VYAFVTLAEGRGPGIQSFEMVRFTESGTEATFYAIRVARAVTGRSRVLKFEGQFHGFNDPLSFSFWPSAAEGGPAGAPIALVLLALPPQPVSAIAASATLASAGGRSTLDLEAMPGRQCRVSR